MLNTVKEKWSDILNYLKNEYELTDVSFNTWILPLEVAAVENNTIYITVPESSFGLDYIKKKYSTVLKVCIEEVLHQAFDLVFMMPDDMNKMDFKAIPEVREEKPDLIKEAGLNPEYTFSSFVVGNNNNLAHAAALAVAESPGEIYNPLYIYGGSGLGKTHLMHAIASFIIQHNPDMKVLYVTSETFTTEMIEAIRVRNNNPMSNTIFRNKYRNVDVLLVDDIQFIGGKQGVQEEFFHTFNALYENKKAIVISSDKPPKEIANLEERLYGRFLWGLPVDIQSPSYEMRMAILKNKIEMKGSPDIPDDVLNYIATNVNSNVRELEGALTKIIAYSKISSSPITLSFAESVLQDIFSSSQREITPDMIIKIVAEHFNVSINDLCSNKRNSEIVYPRQLSMYLCRSLTDAGLNLIGKKLGNRHYSTVIHGYDKIAQELETNTKIKTDVDILKKKIIPS